jgi:hypothetical protein
MGMAQELPRRGTVSGEHPVRDPPSASDSMVQRAIVLFLAANPAELPRVRLDKEVRAIEDTFRAAKYRDLIRLQPRWAARPDDLLDVLNNDAPRVLHFSGHGSGERGLCFEADDGTSARVSAEHLDHVMRAAGASVRLVVLNACYSELQAQAIATHIPCVIGMSDAIGDKAAIAYAASLYRALASGRSVANAHQQGLISLALHATSGQTRDIDNAPSVPRLAIPRLLTGPGTRADRVYLVAPGRRRRRRSRGWVLALVVAAGAGATGLVLRSRPARFAITVQVSPRPTHTDPVCAGGALTLHLGAEARTEDVTSAGEVRYTDLSRSLVHNAARLTMVCDGYDVSGGAEITLEPDHTYVVMVEKSCGNHHCDKDESHDRCPVDCSAPVPAPAAPRPTSAPPQGGPCTRMPSDEIRHQHSTCVRLPPDDPDFRMIFEAERQHGYVCKQIFDCKTSTL